MDEKDMSIHGKGGIACAMVWRGSYIREGSMAEGSLDVVGAGEEGRRDSSSCSCSYPVWWCPSSVG